MEAVQWTGSNYREIHLFAGDHVSPFYHENGESAPLMIRTLEGNMVASLGDYIIRGVQGEFYPCNPDVFWETYEEAQS